MQIQPELIELEGPVIGRRQLQPPEIWSQADEALAELSAAQSDGSYGRRVKYRVVFADNHAIEGETLITEVPQSFGRIVRRNLELIAGRVSQPFFFSVGDRVILGLSDYMDFLNQAQASGATRRAEHDLETYAIDDAASKTVEESLAASLDARLAWEGRRGYRGDHSEDDRLNLLKERLELAEAFCRFLAARGNPWVWPEGDLYIRWRATAYPPGEFFKAPPPVVDSVEGRRLAKRLALAETLVEAAAIAQASDTESELRADSAALERAFEEWRTGTAMA